MAGQAELGCRDEQAVLGWSRGRSPMRVTARYTRGVKLMIPSTQGLLWCGPRADLAAGVGGGGAASVRGAAVSLQLLLEAVREVRLLQAQLVHRRLQLQHPLHRLHLLDLQPCGNCQVGQSTERIGDSPAEHQTSGYACSADA